MKAITVIMNVVCMTALCVSADALPFQWYGDAVWIDFAETNLAAGVKAAIRDDVAHAMSLVPKSDVALVDMEPGDVCHGEYDGRVSFALDTPVNYCEDIIAFFKRANGTIYFQLDSESCSNYVAAVALTNQHAAAVGSFSNFLNQVRSGFDLESMSLNDRTNLFWPPSYVQRWKETAGGRFAEELAAAIPDSPAPPDTWKTPSILAYRMITGLPEDAATPVLCCGVRVYGGGSGIKKICFAYVEGAWRVCLLEL